MKRAMKPRATSSWIRRMSESAGPCVDPSRHGSLVDLIRASGQPWMHCDGHAEPFALTGPFCDSCAGGRGARVAVWLNLADGRYRCSGCLYYELRHPRTESPDL